MAFKYSGRDRTIDDLNTQMRNSGYDTFLKSNAKQFKPKEGEICVRIMPPTWNDIDRWGKYWSITTFLHYSVGPDNGMYLCPDKMNGNPCPVCDARLEALAADDGEEADKFRAGEAPLCYVIDRNDEKAG